MIANCPNCNTSHELEESEVKMTIRCTQCGTLFTREKPKNEATSSLDLELDLDALLIPPEGQELESDKRVRSSDVRENSLTEDQFSLNESHSEHSEFQNLPLELDIAPPPETDKPLDSEDEGLSLNTNFEDLSLNINFEDLSFNATTLDMNNTGAPPENPESEAISDTFREGFNYTPSGSEPVESEQSFAETYAEDSTISQESQKEQALASCCIESLALGRDTCYICGRKLERQSKEVEEELEKTRTQRIQDRTKTSTPTISLSQTVQDKNFQPLSTSSAEDFSDLEKALDTLARESPGAKQIQLTKRKNMLTYGLAILVGLLGLAGLAKIILPSSHEKLMKQYDQIMAKGEPTPEEIVELGLVAAKHEDTEVFSLISMVRNFPEISGGKVLSVNTPYDQQNLGRLSQKKIDLQQNVKSLEEQIKEKNSELEKLSSNKISPKTLKDSLERSQQELKDLTAQYEKKKEEAIAEVASLEQKLQTLREERIEAIETQKRNIDRVDSIGRALYTTHVQREKTLTEQILQTEKDLRMARDQHRRRLSELANQYVPRIEALKTEITETEKQLEMVEEFQDPSRSPIEHMKAEIDTLNVELASLKKQQEEIQALFQEALTYFKNPEEQQVLSSDPNCEFSSVKRDAVLDLQSSSGKGMWVLKRYEVQCQDKTFRSHWLISQIK